ncbi:hypothetical protein Vi05172_g1721 [Venturia inaequalis]|nr:hypothetical protein Vi05172_g1721 [Venturia inaequalis]
MVTAMGRPSYINDDVHVYNSFQQLGMCIRNQRGIRL